MAEPQTVNSKYLINACHELYKGKKVTKELTTEMVSTIFDTIKESLINGNAMTIRGFGSFSLIDKKERDYREPKTGSVVHKQACRYPKWKPSKTLRELVNV